MKNVFIVDDELLSRKILKTAINWEDYGYRICGEATNGEQAMELISAVHPDVIFTDIKMPVMDGLELLQQLKMKHNPAKVIVLSCYDEFDYVREALRSGAVDYILKHTCEETDIVALLKKLDFIFKKELTAKEGFRALQREIFHKMIYGSLKDSEIKEHISSGIIPKLCSFYMVGCFHLASFKNINISEQYIQKVFRYIKDIDSTEISDRLIFFCEEANKYCLIFIGDEQSSILELKTEMKDFLTRLYQFFESVKINCISGISTHAYSDWRNIKDAYDEAIEMLGEETEFMGCSSKILSAVEYIETNYSEQISLADIADYVGISRIYLSQLFKKETGKNINDFLIQYRLKKAKKLLLTSNLKIYSIAEMCGFGSPQYFGQIFKKIVGFSPYQFRDNDTSTK